MSIRSAISYYRAKFKNTSVNSFVKENIDVVFFLGGLLTTFIVGSIVTLCGMLGYSKIMQGKESDQSRSSSSDCPKTKYGPVNIYGFECSPLKYIAPDNQNAFNQKDKASYWYQANDIRPIIEQFNAESKFGKYYLFSDNTVWTSPLYKKEQLKGWQKCVWIKEGDEPVFVVFNLGNGHWVCFASVFHDNKNYILYKNSFNAGVDERLTKILNDPLFKDLPKPEIICNVGSEQGDGASCGIFSLRNLQIMQGELQKNSGEFIKQFKDFKGFCFQQEAQKLRQEYAKQYLIETMKSSVINYVDKNALTKKFLIKILEGIIGCEITDKYAKKKMISFIKKYVIPNFTEDELSRIRSFLPNVDDELKCANDKLKNAMNSLVQVKEFLQTVKINKSKLDEQIVDKMLVAAQIKLKNPNDKAKLIFLFDHITVLIPDVEESFDNIQNALSEMNSSSPNLRENLLNRWNEFKNARVPSIRSFLNELNIPYKGFDNLELRGKTPLVKLDDLMWDVNGVFNRLVAREEDLLKIFEEPDSSENENDMYELFGEINSIFGLLEQ